jgi:ORF6N domain
MNNLLVLEHSAQRVLTTKQLADVYEVTPAMISNNFNNNKDRFVEGIHYFKIEGEQLRAFLTNHKIYESSNRLNLLYLWTERGILHHAKILNSDKAWEVYEVLVETYFRAREKAVPEALPEAEAAPQTKAEVREGQKNWLSAFADHIFMTGIMPLRRRLTALEETNNQILKELAAHRNLIMANPNQNAPEPKKERKPKALPTETAQTPPAAISPDKEAQP